jgi:hypothetical protein
MLIEQMKGSERATLLRSLDHFLRATKLAVRNNEAAFLPTMDGEIQEGRIQEAQAAIPAVDDVAREWEAIEPIANVCRNAIVVHARFVDKIRKSEKEENISTADSDALMEELQAMLKGFGDERNLESVLNYKRNAEAVENKADPAQTDLVDELEAKPFADVLRPFSA